MSQEFSIHSLKININLARSRVPYQYLIIQKNVFDIIVLDKFIVLSLTQIVRELVWVLIHLLNLR